MLQNITNVPSTQIDEDSLYIETQGCIKIIRHLPTFRKANKYRKQNKLSYLDWKVEFHLKNNKTARATQEMSADNVRGSVPWRGDESAGWGESFKLRLHPSLHCDNRFI